MWLIACKYNPYSIKENLKNLPIAKSRCEHRITKHLLSYYLDLWSEGARCYWRHKSETIDDTHYHMHIYLDAQRHTGSCTCMNVKTRRCTDTHSFITHAVAQISAYLHTSKMQICTYTHMHTCNICIHADMRICRYAICRYAICIVHFWPMQLQWNQPVVLPPPSGQEFPSSRDL